MAKVSVVRCEDYDEGRLAKSISRGIDNIGGLSGLIGRGDTVLLKPNLLTAKSSISCITTNARFVKVCAKLVRDYGAKPVVGDSPPISSAHKVAVKTGLYDELKKIGVDIIEFNTPVKLPARDNAIFKDLYVAKEALDVDSIINLPKVKTHTIMTLTACVKNMFGTVIGKQKSLWHLKAGVSPGALARMFLDLYYANPPALTIADMITVMEGDGPGSGTPRDVGLVVTGRDCVAMDSVICEILRIPKNIAYIQKVAKELRDPSADISNIDIIGEDPRALAGELNGIALPKRTDADFGLPHAMKNMLRNMLTSKPVIDKNLCEYCRSCEAICPVDAVKVTKDSVAFDYDKCIRCYCCQEICTYKALKIKEGSLLRLKNIFTG